jgi:hypothetical protein
MAEEDGGDFAAAAQCVRGGGSGFGARFHNEDIFAGGSGHMFS